MTAMPPIPPHGDHQTPDERRQLARRFIIHARQELEVGNRLQAGEKGMGRSGSDVQNRSRSARLAPPCPPTGTRHGIPLAGRIS